MRDSGHEDGKRSKIGGWPLATAILAILVFLFFVRRILTPFVLAAALAFILTPPIDWARRRLRLPRWLIATVFYAVIIAVVMVPIVLYGAAAAHSMARVGTQLPRLVQNYVHALASIAHSELGLSVDAANVSSIVLEREQGLLQSSTVLSAAGFGVGLAFGVILFLVALIYFLISGKRIAAGVFWLVPPEYRSEVNAVTAKILPLLWRYFFGLLVVVAYASAVAWVALGPVFRISNAPMIAFAMGLLELIPLIGPAITFIIVGIISFQQGDFAVTVELFAVAVALRLSIDELVAPLILGGVARLHPVVIIFAFLSGGALFGILGLLLAVPVAASIKIILTMYYAEPVAKRAG